MTTRDILRRARRSLAQAKVRTILTSLAIAVGAFTVTLALAAGEGGRQYTEEMVKTSGDAGSLNVYPKIEKPKHDKLTEYGTSDDAIVQKDKLNQFDIDKIKKINGVDDVLPFYALQPRYVTRGEGSKKYLAEVNVKVHRTEMKLAAGSLDDNRVSRGGITVSEELLSTFGFNNPSSAINQKIVINFPKLTASGYQTEESVDRVFNIVAVDRKTDATLFYQPSLNISVEDGKEIYAYQTSNSNQYDGLVVELNNSADSKIVKQSIIDQNYEAYSLQDIRETLLQMVSIAQWGMVSFGALAILASIFGIINTQYISVLERTQQIGLMKALGARKKDIARLFRYEAAWVGFLGGLTGTVLAVLVGFANPFISKTLGLKESVRLLIFSPLTSAVLILVMMSIAICAGYFPSRKAAKLDPIEALRTE